MERPENAPLRGAIVGCGFFAQFQIEAWRRMPGVELAAACDLDIARAQAAAPRAYASIEEMLDREQLDFVDIATRPETHLPLVRQVTARGIPVICQKPMAPSWGEAVAMVEAAEQAGVPLMIHENWRWQPWFREVARRVSAGDIGEPVSYCFRTRKRDGIGPDAYRAQPYFRQMPRLLIYETLVHQIDTARLIHGDVRQIYAQSRRHNPLIQGEDQVYLVLTHEDGLMGCVDGHRFTDLAPDSPPLGDATFEGQEAMLHVAATGDLYCNGELVWRNTVRQGYRGDSVFATQRHFIDCLRSGAPMESGAREYLKTVACVEAAYLSLDRAARVDINEFLSRAGGTL
jgi:predicted dehydrogenase